MVFPKELKMKMRLPWFILVVAAMIALGFAGPKPAFADNPLLSAICKNVDCLNNFTGKTGYSWQLKSVMAGGFTDFEQSWYLSPVVGFEVPIGKGPSTGTPLLDIGVLFKAGKLLSDKIPYVHSLVNSDPFVAGAMKYLTFGESGGWDYTSTAPTRYYDLTWVGFTVPF
jgi:hypothetical protein